MMFSYVGGSGLALAPEDETESDGEVCLERIDVGSWRCLMADEMTSVLTSASSSGMSIVTTPYSGSIGTMPSSISARSSSTVFMSESSPEL